jgi:type II secretory pathway component PulF
MTTIADPIGDDANAFAFEAQGTDGEAVTGTIDAATAVEATRKLGQLQVRVIALEPVRRATRRRRLGAEDFQTFNTQLAHLTAAGLPVEKSLRLIAEDMHSGRLAESVRAVAVDLESGQSLPDAFEKHAAHFPPLYSQLIHAGVRTGDLSAMLLGLGRHLDLVQRLRNMLWRATAYPIAVLVSLILVVTYLGIYVLPQFKLIFQGFRVDLPQITQIVIAFSNLLIDDWPILLAILVAAFALPLLLRLTLSGEQRQRAIDMLVFPLPIIGGALRRNLLARWSDALRLGVESGLDLPASITLAGQAVGSPGLLRDGELLIETLQAGRSLDEPASAGQPQTFLRTRILPPTVTTVISLATAHNDLPSGLSTLSAMFQQQAERKIATLPALVTPIMIVFIAIVIGFVIIALFAPMIALISAVSGPVRH